MRVMLLLADFAQVAENKLYVMGGGWSVAGPGPTTMAVAVKIDVPWDQTNLTHRWRLELVDADGQPVPRPTPEGDQPIMVSGEFEVGRPSGLPEGTPIDLPMAVNLVGVPLPAHQRLVWKMWIDDETREDWELRFTTRAAAPQHPG